ncbi:MAG TPA: YceI family protein [Acidimicrobiia bacterium]|nr:YceI family protein [Acidimicrobiia bacterium]
MTITGEEALGTPPPPSRRGLLGQWRLLLTAAVAVVVVGFGVHFWQEYRTVTSAKYTDVNYTVPTAPHLVANSGETVYRIDPTHSTLTYGVAEKLFGHTAHTAHGTTQGIAGDLAVNESHPSTSRVGKIVVNVEQLHSDNNLRDARIRAANLDSHDYPLVSLSVSKLSGLPARIENGHTYHFAMSSQLTVKGTSAPASWSVDAKVEGGKVTATAITHVKLTQWGVGPISIVGLVSTSNDATLTMKLTALDPSKFTIPDHISPPVTASHPNDSPSFKNVVMPILRANCASCHQPGQIGASQWTLSSARDAAAVSDGIGAVVHAKYMPPWPASTLGVPLAHSKQLSSTQIDEIVKWADAGGPLDVPASTRITPTLNPTTVRPRADVTLQMNPAYAGSLSNANDYRCFVLDPHFTKPTYVTGYGVTPGHLTEIHHAQIFHIDAAQAAQGKERSGSDGKPGWSCYGGPALDSFGGNRLSRTATTAHYHRHRVPGFTGQPGLIAGWVPGQDPTVYPDGSGILMEPGDALVLQIHYHYSATPIPDRTTVTLQTAPGTSKVKPIDIINPIAPVEIPCMPGATARLCDRTNAIQDDVRLYGPSGAGNEAGLLALCGTTPEKLAANFHDGVASTTCNYTVPESGTMVGALGHMHTLGKSFRLTLDPGTAQQKVLLDIPTWNFDWQMNYEFQKAIHVTAGQTIQMTCSWDRALDPNRPQKYIVFAEGTEDEMCFGTYAIIPDKY